MIGITESSVLVVKPSWNAETITTDCDAESVFDETKSSNIRYWDRRPKCYTLLIMMDNVSR